MLDALADFGGTTPKTAGACYDREGPVRSDELAAEIRRVFDERELLRNAVRTKEHTEQG